jgi:hypothetical protein
LPVPSANTKIFLLIGAPARLRRSLFADKILPLVLYDESIFLACRAAANRKMRL